VFEEDTDEGAVYRPEDADIPPSRRPREQLVLDEDGRATLFSAGPDDRLVGRPLTWAAAGAKSTDKAADIRIVQRAPDRLVVKIE